MDRYGNLPTPEAKEQFQGAFGYPQLPTQELMAEQEQQRALAMQQEAKQARLLEQMRRAEATRNRPGNYGSVGSALGSLMSFAGGDANVRRTEGRMEDNDNALAGSMAAVQEAKAQKGRRDEQRLLAGSLQAYDDQALTREQREKESLLRASTAAADRKSRERIARQKRLAARDALESGYIRLAGDDTQEKHRARWNPEDGLYHGADGQTWTQDEVKQYGPQKINDKFDRKMAAEAPQNLKITYKFMDYDQDDWARIGSPMLGLPTEVLQKFFIDGEKSGILEWAEENADGGLFGKDKLIDREALQDSIAAMNEIRTHVIMPYREETTSGQLSDRDVVEFTENIFMQYGAPGKVLMESAQSLLGNREAHLRSRLRGWEQEGDENAYTRAKGGIQNLREEGWQQAQDKARFRGANAYDRQSYEEAGTIYERHQGTPPTDPKLRKRYQEAVRYLQEYAPNYADGWEGHDVSIGEQ